MDRIKVALLVNGAVVILPLVGAFVLALTGGDMSVAAVLMFLSFIFSVVGLMVLVTVDTL